MRVISISHVDMSRKPSDPPCMYCTSLIPLGMIHVPILMAGVLYLGTSVAYAREDVYVAVA